MTEAMTRTHSFRPRRSPQRTCVACRQVQSKKTMIRIVRGPAGILVDPTSKLSGRGAYLHANRSCWAIGLGLEEAGNSAKGASPLERALKTRMSPSEREVLGNYIESLGDAPPDLCSQSSDTQVAMPEQLVRAEAD